MKIMITLHCWLYPTKKGNPLFHLGKSEVAIQISCLIKMTSHAWHLFWNPIYHSLTSIKEVLNTLVPDLKKKISLKNSNKGWTRTHWWQISTLLFLMRQMRLRKVPLQCRAINSTMWWPSIIQNYQGNHTIRNCSLIISKVNSVK